MRIAVFGGSFNPPHIGHVRAARAALCRPGTDRLLVVPAFIAPHKPETPGSPAPGARLELARLAFADVAGVEVSDIELRRGGKSYTVDTLEALRREYPGDELVLLMGADMLECFDTKWYAFERIMELASLGVFSRKDGEDKLLAEKCAYLREKYGARIERLDFEPADISSTRLREMLPERFGREFLPEAVYAEIIRKRYYNAQPDLEWLRERVSGFMDENRMAHVLGCAREARRLAERWGANPLLAAEAGLLHDITKKQKAEEQLKLCEEYGIITDNDEINNYKLLHSKTGAAVAREQFGVSDAVYGAILWHTTGRADMSLLEKIIYIADYIEPNREFEGLDALRALAYEDLDRAVEMGLEMSLADLIRQGKTPHYNTTAARNSIKEKLKAI